VTELNKKQKYMDVKEFREKGYLQELNRNFLHPLGLAMSVSVDDNGNESLGNIWDAREKTSGISYDLAHSSDERLNKFRQNASFVNTEFQERFYDRMDNLDFEIEPMINCQEDFGACRSEKKE
jgi:hypothetical protein